jgi:hypothetical protein
VIVSCHICEKPKCAGHASDRLKCCACILEYHEMVTKKDTKLIAPEMHKKAKNILKFTYAPTPTEISANDEAGDNHEMDQDASPPIACAHRSDNTKIDPAVRLFTSNGLSSIF